MSKLAKLTVSKAEKLTDDAIAISLMVPEQERENFKFIPGQFLGLEAEIDGEKVRRSYSICSTPEAGLRVGIKRVQGGKFSNFAQSLKAGDKLDVLPPDGRFVCAPEADKSKHLLLIAAGSGITPVLSIAASTLDAEKDSRVTLVFGNQKTSSIMFREELEDLKDRFLERFHVFHLLSREAQDVELFHGRIDTHKIGQMTHKGIIDPLHADGIYLCGPSAMTLSLGQHFKSIGVSDQKIHTELFEAPDDLTPVTISEEARMVAQSGVEINVILDGLRRNFTLDNPEMTVLQAAENSGLDLPFSCAGGMCATCRCKIVEGEGEMDRNFSLDTWELDAGYVLACQLRPKSSSLLLDFDAT